MKIDFVVFFFAIVIYAQIDVYEKLLNNNLKLQQKQNKKILLLNT